MYTLRIVMPDMTENILLGKSYCVIHRLNAKRFNEICDEKQFNKETHHAIIYADENNQEIVCTSDYEYYIMIDGKTVENLSKQK